MVCLSTKMVLNTSGASRAGSTQRQKNFTLSCHSSSKFHSSEFRLILGWLITWALAQIRSSESQSSETNEKWICLCVFLFFTFGHSVSVRDDGLGQNDQFNFLQFVYFCVIMKQYSLTVQVFTLAHRCAMSLWQRVLLCVHCNAIFICRIFQTYLYMYKCDLTLRDYQPADKSRHPGALKGCLLLHLIKP